MAKRGKLKERPRELSVRPTITRHYKEFFLIVCEDESTEPAYFRKVFQERFEELLPKDTIRIETVGTGRNSLGVVEKAVEERISRTEIVPKGHRPRVGRVRQGRLGPKRNHCQKV
jgi:hypothetical protein